ncbi:hypothetical protein FSARC_343 [Fusarium sarcochroum]|uniref:Uncharacterized protein n=1 Tax=Fusarium sarcochroum TaxID=1208366 RepID=A0A8H4UBI7_9HYPO|nr:hypothetical protein FSARC_343 [Fusarium sarcochroum]
MSNSYNNYGRSANWAAGQGRIDIKEQRNAGVHIDRAEINYHILNSNTFIVPKLNPNSDAASYVQGHFNTNGIAWNDPKREFSEKGDAAAQMQEVKAIWLKCLDSLSPLEHALATFKQNSKGSVAASEKNSGDQEDAARDDTGWPDLQDGARDELKAARDRLRTTYMLPSRISDNVDNLGQDLEPLFAWLSGLPTDEYRRVHCHRKKSTYHDVVESLNDELAMANRESKSANNLGRETSNWILNNNNANLNLANSFVVLLNASPLTDGKLQELAPVNRPAVSTRQARTRRRRGADSARSDIGGARSSRTGHPQNSMPDISDLLNTWKLLTNRLQELNRGKLLALLHYDPDIVMRDIDANSTNGLIDPDNLRRLSTVTNSDTFQSWLKDEDVSSALLVHGLVEPGDGPSLLSFLCTALYQTYSAKQRIIVLTHFCQERASLDPALRGPSSILVDMIGQLVSAWGIFPLLRLGFLSKTQRRKIADHDFEALCTLFFRMLRQLQTHNLVIFCLIDSISAYESVDTARLLSTLWHEMRPQNDGRQRNLVFKLLVTDPTTTSWAWEYFEGHGVIDFAQHGEGIGEDIEGGLSLGFYYAIPHPAKYLKSDAPLHSIHVAMPATCPQISETTRHLTQQESPDCLDPAHGTMAAIDAQEMRHLKSESKGGLILGINVALLTITSIIAISRFYVRSYIVKTFGWDDALAVIAFALIIAGSAIEIKLVGYGAGSHIVTLSEDQINNYFVLMPTNQLLSFICGGDSTCPEPFF